MSRNRSLAWVFLPGLAALTYAVPSNAQPCTSVKICAQAAVEAAARAEAAAKVIAERVDSLKIQCETSKASGAGHYPVVVAAIPKDKLPSHALTGGSCSMNYHPAIPHNGTMLESKPLADGSGWHCKAGDPPNVPLAITVTAEVIFCRLTR